MKKTVTVSIPVYNGERFILEALQSVVDQTLKVDQIIICDNLSSDNTIELVNQFVNKHKDWNIKLNINKENIGFQNNFIKCYDLAKTDYLVILHVDDLLKSDTIERQQEFFKEHPQFAAVGGNVDTINSKGNLVVKNDISKNLLFRKGEIYEFISATASYIPFSTVMYNLNLSRDVAYLTEDSVGPEELYWPLLLQKHPIALLGESLIDNRSYGGQMHISNSSTMFDKYIKHYSDKINKSDLERSPDRVLKTKKIIEQQVSRMSIKIGQEIFLHNKDFKMALKYYIYGIKMNESVIFTKFFLKSLLKATGLYK